jgi:hypothetical protein
MHRKAMIQYIRRIPEIFRSVLGVAERRRVVSMLWKKSAGTVIRDGRELSIN